jgi:hypothetical protein
MLSYISLSTQSGNFWIYPRILFSKFYQRPAIQVLPSVRFRIPHPYKRQVCYYFVFLCLVLFHRSEGDEIKLKVKLSLCFFNWAPRHEGVFRSGVIAPLILDLGSRWRWVVSFTTWPLYPQGKRPWYPLDRRLGGPQSRSGRSGEEKNSQSLTGLEHPITQRYTTELYRLPGGSENSELNVCLFMFHYLLTF